MIVTNKHKSLTIIKTLDDLSLVRDMWQTLINFGEQNRAKG